MDRTTPAVRALHQEVRFTHVKSGARIAWSRSGRAEPNAPVLVRAAHWTTHVEYDAVSPIYRPSLERLGRGLRLVCHAERGGGLSGPDDTPVNLAAPLEDLEVVGDASAEHLVPRDGYTHGLLQRSLTPESQAYVKAIARLMQHGWGQATSAAQQFFSASLIPDATPEQREAMNERQRRSCDGKRAAAIFRARSQPDVRPLLAQVQCPTLVMHCDRDALVHVELGRDLAAAIPGARFEALRSRNHVPLPGA